MRMRPHINRCWMINNIHINVIWEIIILHKISFHKRSKYPYIILKNPGFVFLSFFENFTKCLNVNPFQGLKNLASHLSRVFLSIKFNPGWDKSRLRTTISCLSLHSISLLLFLFLHFVFVSYLSPFV